ncbi:HNH endonuclease [Streptomyces sp. NBC_01764]|uniref:HNH endonuclease signature motif containing protein n=1 Tax=Streptomyces sp. NBC_01764 TaxID=2975935 RepID=UPI002254ED36|nr:HNH endonuclease signature motif containing protein [Streptomyces sp. NBC_01764]MCX4400643.1 HNH endonuclease [Streptomyces sp. NBC_01764]
MCSRCNRLYTLGERCEQCSKAGAKRREQKRQRTRPSPWARGYNTQYAKARAAILAAQPVCSICNARPATTADHIIPLSKGGTNDIENLRPACGRCNSSRGNRTT